MGRGVGEEVREGGEEEVPKSEQARRKTKAMAARMVLLVRRRGMCSCWVGKRVSRSCGADEDKVCVHPRLLAERPDWPILKVTQHNRKRAGRCLSTKTLSGTTPQHQTDLPLGKSLTVLIWDSKRLQRLR